MELSDKDISLLQDIFEMVSDRARHHEDADMGWTPEEVRGFYDLSSRHYAEAKSRGFWWAR